MPTSEGQGVQCTAVRKAHVASVLILKREMIGKYAYSSGTGAFGDDSSVSL